MKPRTWEPGRAPTPEQWLAWFLSQDPDDQLLIAGHVTRSQEVATHCEVAGHESLLQELEHTRQALMEAPMHIGPSGPTDEQIEAQR